MRGLALPYCRSFGPRQAVSFLLASTRKSGSPLGAPKPTAHSFKINSCRIDARLMGSTANAAESSRPVPPSLLSPSERIKFTMTCPEFRDSVWGFVIYRCAKGTEAAWKRMLQALREGVEEELKAENREELLQYHRLDVIDDEAL
ncbi:hypothetical protein F4778DRAFT_573063 [Xylariomycetidae sp. FL2044]|nr:hypothetical protein F4778DRAFT_573063 [Xylariomycetidae sp. FL2044]